MRIDGPGAGATSAAVVPDRAARRVRARPRRARTPAGGHTGPVSDSATPLRRIEDRFRSRDGTALFRRAWLPAEPRRAAIVVHGFGEHSGRYEGFARWLSGRGFAVHAYDQRGHGRSPGRRGHADTFDVLLDDLDAFVAFVADTHPPLPRVVIGHSMGALVATAYVCERQAAIDRLVVSGAPLGRSPGFSRPRVWLTRSLRAVLPRLTLRAGPEAEALSRDPEVVRTYLEDPLVHVRVSAALSAGMLDAQRRTAASAGRVPVPMLLLHGEDDRLCAVAGSRAFHDALPHDRVAGSGIRTYAALRHEIFNEPEREAVYGDLLAWLEAPPGAWPG